MMSLISQLLSSRKSTNRHYPFKKNATVNIEIDGKDRSSINFGADQVRILLFRECEWQGRKLIFDSLATQSPSSKSSFSSIFKSDRDRRCKCPTETVNNLCQHVKMACDDVNLLSEMVFSTVAMTYRGPSFKIHAINSPSCIMSTKVFPVTEHSIGKSSRKYLDKSFTRFPAAKSNSRCGNLQTECSRSSSENLTESNLSPDLYGNSTGSNIESGWNVHMFSFHDSYSLGSNNSSRIDNSLSSHRRRWIRAVSTSLSRSESEVFPDHHYNENSWDQEYHVCRHKTRLGLAILIRFTQGHEREMEAKLLEHAALLEGMLDRLRISCIDSNQSQNSVKGKRLIDRFYRATSLCKIMLSRLLVGSVEKTFPLLWHDVMLNRILPGEERFSIIQNGLQGMCDLVDQIDIKSTNFFLSTMVTAVLTHHLGWVHTVLSDLNQYLVEKLRKQYPCNPLWAQLGDLYGALGNPVKVVHTVVAGERGKANLINSILTFLSYFIRSGIVEKQFERRCSSQQDVLEAIVLLEQQKLKHSSLFKSCIFENSDLEAHRKTSKRQIEPIKCDVIDKIRDTQKLKRSSTFEKNLDSLPLDPSKGKNEEKISSTSKVEIIVNEIPREIGKESSFSQSVALQELEKKFDLEMDEYFMGEKHELLQCDPISEMKKLGSEKYENFSSHDSNPSMIDMQKEAQTFFSLRREEEYFKSKSKSRCKCQCAFTFARVPSTSADLPESVLRKIIQRNFPESSKNIQLSLEGISNGSLSLNCLKCSRNNETGAQSHENNKIHFETPTNATEVLRSCGNSGSNDGMCTLPSNSLEALMEVNNVIELPMPRSDKIPFGTRKSNENIGFTDSLMSIRKLIMNDGGGDPSYDFSGSEYTWGMVMQGLMKNRRLRGRTKNEKEESNVQEKKEWWDPIREEIEINAKFPLVDQPVTEAFCILADVDTWRVGLLSSNTPLSKAPLPIGMSRLVANTLEAFSYIWKKYRSPEHCVRFLESRLREMWLRSESLAEMLKTSDPSNINVNDLTESLDLNISDLPLLFSVATTHSPQIAQKFNLILA